MSSISASTTSTTGFKVTADTTGTLVLQTGSTPTTAVTIDGSQNVGIGLTPPTGSGTYKSLNVGAAMVYGNTASALAAYNSNADINDKYIINGFASSYVQSSGTHTWYYAASGTAGNAISYSTGMKLDASGTLMIGTTTNGLHNSNSVVAISYNGSIVGQIVCNHASGTGTGEKYAQFGYNGAAIGSISQNGTTGVLYNLTSDYRLKNNQEALTGAKDFIMALKPKKWQWWDGSGEGVGFVAHEFMEVAKYSGHGEKDAVETIEIKDEDGNVTGTEERPVYQSIQPSSSEVMANLVSLIQEQQALITQLQADVAALKG